MFGLIQFYSKASVSTEESQRVIEFFQSISHDDAENDENDEDGENG
jgi:hypothetical protein